MRTIPVLMLLLAGCATRPAQPRADVGAFAARGEGRRCLLDSDIRSWQPVDQRYLMVATAGGWFRTELVGGCPGLDWRRAIVRRNSTGQACRGDTFGVVDLTTRNDFGLCRFGDFVPVEVPKGSRF